MKSSEKSEKLGTEKLGPCVTASNRLYFPFDAEYLRQLVLVSILVLYPKPVEWRWYRSEIRDFEKPTHSKEWVFYFCNERNRP